MRAEPVFASSTTSWSADYNIKCNSRKNWKKYRQYSQQGVKCSYHTNIFQEVRILSYTHFTLSERICLQKYYEERKKIREIARLMGRSPSTISRELKRNFSVKRNGITRGELRHYTLFDAENVFASLQLCREQNFTH